MLVTKALIICIYLAQFFVIPVIYKNDRVAGMFVRNHCNITVLFLIQLMFINELYFKKEEDIL